MKACKHPISIDLFCSISAYRVRSVVEDSEVDETVGAAERLEMKLELLNEIYGRDVGVAQRTGLQRVKREGETPPPDPARVSRPLGRVAYPPVASVPPGIVAARTFVRPEITAKVGNRSLSCIAISLFYQQLTVNILVCKSS